MFGTGPDMTDPSNQPGDYDEDEIADLKEVKQIESDNKVKNDEL